MATDHKCDPLGHWVCELPDYDRRILQEPGCGHEGHGFDCLCDVLVPDALP